MRLHAGLEEKYIHPLLLGAPGAAREIEQDHKAIHTMFDDLITSFEAMMSKPHEYEKLGEMLLEFYRGWSRFLSYYFMHINKEEELIMPTLWKLSNEKELAGAFRSIITNQTPQELKYDFVMMMPALNQGERAEILTGGRINMPPEAFRGFLALTQSLLEPNDWEMLKKNLGI